jgi:hypothetical protein
LSKLFLLFPHSSHVHSSFCMTSFLGFCSHLDLSPPLGHFLFSFMFKTLKVALCLFNQHNNQTTLLCLILVGSLRMLLRWAGSLNVSLESKTHGQLRYPQFGLRQRRLKMYTKFHAGKKRVNFS